MATPLELGLPEHFTEFRNSQLDIVMRLLASDKRVTLLEAPTGSGKTILGMALAKNWIEGRAVVLTGTKGLQDQIARDFGEMEGFKDIRGQSNYPCIELYKAQGKTGLELPCSNTVNTRLMNGEIVLPNMGCDNGPCKTGWKCPLRESGCYYYDARQEACDSQIISTNYAYWMGIRNYGYGLGADKIGLLILDEGHEAGKLLRGFMSVSLGWKRVQKISNQLGMTYPTTTTAELWRQWASEASARVESKLELMQQGGGDTDMTDLRENLNRCSRLSSLQPDWYFDAHETYGIKASPSVVDRYAEKYLFQGIPRIIIMSGTLRREMAPMLGLADEEVEYVSIPSTFPPARRPLYSVPTIIANYKATESDWRTWLNRIDMIIKDRQDRKGIIHTVSYQRAKFVKANSRFGHLMLMHESGETQQAVEEFKASTEPMILLSPSIVTGFDFPDDDCRYQIIAKLPYPDTRNGPEKILAAKIKGYVNLQVAMLLSQAYGRSTRSEVDWSEVFVLDDSFGKWFLRQANHLMPKYVLEAVRKVEYVPQPPPLDY